MAGASAHLEKVVGFQEILGRRWGWGRRGWGQGGRVWDQGLCQQEKVSGVGAGCTRASMSVCCAVCVCVCARARARSIRKAAALLWAESHYKQFQMWCLAQGSKGLCVTQ